MQIFLPILFAIIGLSSAHTVLNYVWINGVDTKSCVRSPPNNSPVQNTQSSDMACNVNGARPASSVCTISAGSQITFEWHWEARNTEAIADSHKGPIITYMAKTNSASQERNPANLQWFKINEAGINGGKWAADTLRANSGKWTVGIPKSIPQGEYLIRSEIVALHSAYSSGGAQFYIGCAQIKVTGGGSTLPPTVRIPGAYSATDPGILVNIYNGQGKPYPSSYKIPGPAVFNG